jgi:Mor family transcriptional regulator
MTKATTREMRSKGPELLAHFGYVLADQLCKEGLPEHRASAVSLNVMDVIKVEFGGQNVYFPMGISGKTEEKSEEVFDKFMAGTTVTDLDHEYGHSMQWIYRLLSIVRARRRAEREAGREAAKAKEYERWKREN